jgi:hypothetical protein
MGVEGYVLIALVEHEPAGGTIGSFADDFAVLPVPLRLTDRVPSIQACGLESGVGYEAWTDVANLG